MIQKKQAGYFICGNSLHEELINFFNSRFRSEDVYNIEKYNLYELLRINPITNPNELKELYKMHYNFGGQEGTTYKITKYLS